MRPFPGLSPTRRRLRAVRRQLRLRRRLIAAVLVGLATLAILRALAPPAPESVEVAVAARDLPAGTLLVPDDVTLVSYPAGVVPEALAPTSVGRVLAAPVTRGEPVTSVRLVGAALVEADPGDTALPLRLPDAGMAVLVALGTWWTCWPPTRAAAIPDCSPLT